MEDNELSKRELARLKKENPKAFDPLKSYGIIPRQKRPADTLYVLDYDSRTRYLKLNGVVIRQFQLESNADIYFTKLFKNKGWVKTVKVEKPARASVIVNNTGIPIELRNAIFEIGINETLLVVHTVIRRNEAKKFNVNIQQIDDYLVKMRDQRNSLLKVKKSE